MLAVWQQIIVLLKMEIYEEDATQFWAGITVLNLWVIRQYAPVGITCEEVELAYNMLIMEKLTRPVGEDFKILEAYKALDPKHVGEVMAAYLRWVESNNEIRKVISKGMLDEPVAEQSQEEIDVFMEKALAAAVNVVRLGGRYAEVGNGLYQWLYGKGRIKLTDDQWNVYLESAIESVKQNLVAEKASIKMVGGAGKATFDAKDQSRRNMIEKKLSDIMLGFYTPDYRTAVREEAQRMALNTFLLRLAGPIVACPLPDKRPEWKPYSHTDWVKGLATDITDRTNYTDEMVSDLQKKAKQMNWLDVHEIATEEWNRRTNKPTTNG